MRSGRRNRVGLSIGLGLYSLTEGGLVAKRKKDRCELCGTFMEDGKTCLDPTCDKNKVIDAKLQGEVDLELVEEEATRRVMSAEKSKAATAAKLRVVSKELE